MSILDQSAASGGQILDPIQAAIQNPFSTTVKNNGERPNDFPGGFQVIEYIDGIPQNGANGASNTVIKLVGNLMPFQPFEWSREQRLVKEYYPGNPEATVQVLGGKIGPLVIRGRFKDKRYKDPSYYGVSYQYTQLFENMIDRGNLVKFGMHGQAGDWFRWGYLEKVSFKMNKLSWIDYEIEFFSVSDHQPINNYFAAQEKQAPSSINSNLINSATAFNQNYSTIPTSMPTSLASKINSLISGVAKNINLVTNFVGTIVNTAEAVEASANRALGLIKHCRTSIYELQTSIDNITHGFNTLSSQGAPAGQTRDFYTNTSYIAETSLAAHQMSQYLVQMQAQFQAIALSVPKARYRVKAGDTLQNLSVKFYGVVDYWENIQVHNQLQSTLLVAGTILEIPNL